MVRYAEPYPRDTLLGAVRTSPWLVLLVGILGAQVIEILGNLLYFFATGYIGDTYLEYVLLGLGIDVASPSDLSITALHLYKTGLALLKAVIPILVMGNLGSGWRREAGLTGVHHRSDWLLVPLLLVPTLLLMYSAERLSQESGLSAYLYDHFRLMEPRRMAMLRAAEQNAGDIGPVVLLTIVLSNVGVALFNLGWVMETLRRAIGSGWRTIVVGAVLIALLRLYPSKYLTVLAAIVSVCWLRVETGTLWPSMVLFLLVNQLSMMLFIRSEVTTSVAGTVSYATPALLLAGVALFAAVVYWYRHWLRPRQETEAA